MWSELWTSTEEYLPRAISILQEQGLLEYQDLTNLPFRLLLKQKWHLRLFIVFDICNQDYDAATSHLPSQNRLPVAIVQYGKGHRVFASTATPDTAQRVNYETGEIHNLTGMDSLPPFVVDATTTIPCYLKVIQFRERASSDNDPVQRVSTRDENDSALSVPSEVVLGQPSIWQGG